jgi:hypothetical protein
MAGIILGIGFPGVRILWERHFLKAQGGHIWQARYGKTLRRAASNPEAYGITEEAFEAWGQAHGLGRTAYPELYAALGGASAVPDLRGQFLRGVGGNSAAIGVKQTDATYIREGEAKQTLFGVKETMMASAPLGDYDADRFSFLTTGILPANGYFSRHSSGSTVDLNFKISTPGVTETRPANVAVRYLIRALP